MMNARSLGRRIDVQTGLQDDVFELVRCETTQLLSGSSRILPLTTLYYYPATRWDLPVIQMMRRDIKCG
jgi:hypothetical protein